MVLPIAKELDLLHQKVLIKSLSIHNHNALPTSKVCACSYPLPFILNPPALAISKLLDVSTSWATPLDNKADPSGFFIFSGVFMNGSRKFEAAVLVEYGASKNFMNQKLAKAFGLDMAPGCPIVCGASQSVGTYIITLPVSYSVLNLELAFALKLSKVFCIHLLLVSIGFAALVFIPLLKTTPQQYCCNS